MYSRSRRQTWFVRYAKAPIRALVKARDFYVRRMTQLSNSVVVGYAGGIMAVPTAPVLALQPKSFSVNYSRSSALMEDDEKLRELIPAASQRGLNNRQCSVKYSKPLVRSLTVGMGRIDEEKTCEFGDLGMMPELVYPRSRSYSVSKKINANVVS